MEEQDENNTTLKVQLHSDRAKLPMRATPFSAGYDLFASEYAIILSHDIAIISTDVSMAIPIGYYGRIAPRSSLAVKNHIDVGAGVVDADYRGIIKVVLFNHSNSNFEVNCGDRIAQLIITKIITPEIEQVGLLSPTIRGTGGFGSTGIN